MSKTNFFELSGEMLSLLLNFKKLKIVKMLKNPKNIKEFEERIVKILKDINNFARSKNYKKKISELKIPKSM